MRKIIKQKYLKAVIVAVVFIGIFAVTFMLNRAYIAKNTDMVSLVVATKKIPAYSLITKDNVRLAKKPRADVTKETVTDMKLFLEEQHYTGDLGLGEGDIINKDRLFGTNNSPIKNIASLETNNKMLVSVNTNLVQSCANLITPGTLVDAIVYIEGDGMGLAEKVLSPAEDPRLSNLLVVDKKNADAAATAVEGRDAIPAVITIMVDKTNMDIAKALVEYNEKGNVYLLPVGFKGETYLAAQ